jgi:broad specificity phosphatase PhoE
VVLVIPDGGQVRLIYPVVPIPAPRDRVPGLLVVVRHGTTSWSREGRHTGRTEVALEAQGVREARRVGEALAGHHFARVLSSPRSRARETCALAGFAPREEVCEDLAEWDYGGYEGKTTVQIRADRPGWLLWRDGVEGGETLDQVAVRAERVVDLALETEGDTLAFAHGHILRVVCARWVELPAAEGARFVLRPGAIGVLSWENEVRTVARWNDTSPDPLQ